MRVTSAVARNERALRERGDPVDGTSCNAASQLNRHAIPLPRIARVYTRVRGFAENRPMQRWKIYGGRGLDDVLDDVSARVISRLMETGATLDETQDYISRNTVSRRSHLRTYVLHARELSLFAARVEEFGARAFAGTATRLRL